MTELPASDPGSLDANAARFAGSADLYDAVRPTPPDDVAHLLVAYAGGDRPELVVDLGCGSGLSTRWAATWSDAVIGVEPGDAMRAVAEQQTPANARITKGWAHDTGLAAHAADIVLAVQALHWMEPVATHAEVGRLLRPGGVFAAIDCDWPPSSGDVEADQAWAESRKIVRVYEKRLALGLRGDDLRAPVSLDDPELDAHTVGDTHTNRTLALGVRSWSKDGHLGRMVDSGVYRWCHEVALHRVDLSDAARFVGLLRSQGDYQTLRLEGLDDELLGATHVERVASRVWQGGLRPLVFTYRVRIGVVA
jgi:SAM-dependent methyltransferase